MSIKGPNRWERRGRDGAKVVKVAVPAGVHCPVDATHGERGDLEVQDDDQCGGLVRRGFARRVPLQKVRAL